jgi:hypothetical protein
VRFEKRDVLSYLVVLGLSISLGCSKKSGEPTAPSAQETQAQTQAPAASVDTEKPVAEIQAQTETRSVDALKNGDQVQRRRHRQ